MKSFTKKYEIQAPLEKVWLCLTDADEMNKWGAEPATFIAEINSEFTMWGDYINGKVTKIIKYKILEEEWTVEGMDVPSLVTFRIEENNNITIVELTHGNIPDNLVDELFQGWDDHYLGAIKDYLEN